MTIKEEKIVEKAQEFLARNYGPFPVVISKAKGVWVWDVNGKKYIDMLSIWSAVNQGHRHPKIVKALVGQAKKVTLTSRAFYNEVLGEFAEKLAKVSGMEMVLPMNSGAEAVETAIKTSRKWGYKVKKVEENKAEIIACKNNFHGRTTTITGFSTDEKNRDGFGPFTPGFKTIPFNDAQALQEAITKNTVAFLAEPIQIEGGINFPSENYFKEARKICDENNVLLVLDEIQTGFGRTGKLFAHEHYGIKPDVMTVGKALGGGVFPVSAVVSSKEVLGVFNPGEHGSTFAGNPLACAVGIAAIDVIIKENLAQNAEKIGEYFLEKLKTLDSDYILDLRGKGLLIGIDIDHNKGNAHDLCFELAKNSVLTKDVTNKKLDSVLRFTPPLIIKEKEIDWGFERISKVFSN